jgi:hypothetical protein
MGHEPLFRQATVEHAQPLHDNLEAVARENTRSKLGPAIRLQLVAGVGGKQRNRRRVTVSGLEQVGDQVSLMSVVNWSDLDAVPWTCSRRSRTGGNRELELLSQTNEEVEIDSSVAVGMDSDLPTQNVHESLILKRLREVSQTRPLVCNRL